MTTTHSIQSPHGVQAALSRQGKSGNDRHTTRTGQGNGVLGQREGKEGNRAQQNPDGDRHQRSS